MPREYHIADLFCGAGGTSTGAIEAIQACGYDARLTAINHWPVAVATHEANHPGARHLCTSIDDVNPRRLFEPRQLKLLWASPECTHFSTARGGKPINDQSRATAWCVIRWAEALMPSVILVENVPVFRTWGPTDRNGKPVKKYKGATFRAWIAALESLVYRVEHRILCAADYGDPTDRKRLFIQAVRGRLKVVWPAPTHGNGQKPWVPARQIIDWGILAPSIFERSKPLSSKTMNRIWEGLRRFGFGSFILPVQTGEKRVRSVEKPLQTVTTEARGIGLAQPFIIAIDHHGGNGHQIRGLDKPLSTISTKARHCLLKPFLVQVAHGNGRGKNGDKRRVRSIDAPLAAVCGQRGDWALGAPFLVELRGTSKRQLATTARSIEKPLPTVTAGGGHIAIVQPGLLPQHGGGIMRAVSDPVPTVAAAGAIGLVEPFLIPYYGTGVPASINHPLRTVSTHDRFGLVRPTVKIEGKTYLLDIGFRMLQPHELAAAQGFPIGYKFSGNKTEVVKQIGNAVPRGLARALVRAVIQQRETLDA